MKVAIVYDRVNKWGGAERVLLSLHKIFPKASLYTSVYEKKNAAWAKVFRVHTSFLQKIPFIRSHHEYFPFLMPFAFLSFSFKKYDVVISVTSEFAKGIIVPTGTKHVCICLTPTRYLWSGYDAYFQNKTFRFLTKPLVFLLRKYDRMIARLPDEYLAISQEVQKRIKKYYGRQSCVVYPPVATLPKPKKNPFFQKNYFLVVSRLSKFTSYKRIDLAIKAANLLSASLVIVGDGDNAPFKKITGPTVHFTGKISDEKLSEFYSHAKALIFPADEDFGIAMVEALSFGKPVIAYKKGGALEIVKPGKTGIFFASQTVASLVEALKSFEKGEYNSSTCQESVKRFSESVFGKEIKKIVRRCIVI